MDRALLVGLVFFAVGAGSVMLLWDSDVQAFIKSAVPNEDYAKADAVLAALAQVLMVPSAKLARDVEMTDLFTLRSKSSDRRLEPFAYDIVDKLHSASDRVAWDRLFQSDAQLPKNEDQLANFVMQMRVSQVLKVFAPIAARPRN